MTAIDPNHHLHSAHTTFIPAGSYDLAETIRDPDSWDGWVHKNTRFEMVQQNSPTDYVTYMRQRGVGWLRIKDRDAVLHSKVHRDPNGTLHLRGHETTHPDKPALHDVIRMPAMRCRFEIEPTEEGSNVTYAVDLDLGGMIPMWLKRRVTGEIARNTLGDLRRYMEAAEPRGPSELQAALEPRGSAAARTGAAVGAARRARR